MSKKVQHVHKFQKIKIGSYTSKKERWAVYKCMLPGCNSFIPIELALGRETICWACGKVFTIKKNRMLRKPTCGCRAKFKHEEVIELPQLLDLVQ